MMAISTSGIGKMDILQPQSRVKGKNDDAPDGAFSSLMDLAKASSTDVNGSFTQETKDVTKLAPADNKKQPQSDDVTKTDSTKTDVKAEDKPVQKDDAVQKDTAPEKVADQTKKTEVPDDTVVEIPPEIVEIVAESMTNLLTEALSVTEEELTGMLEESGVSLGELIEPETLKQFVLDAGGKTDVDLLTDENLANTVSELTDAMAALVEENNITDYETFAKAVASLVEETAQTVTEEITVPVQEQETPALFEEQVPVLDEDTVIAEKKPEGKDVSETRRTESPETQTVETTVNDIKVQLTTQTESTSYRETRDHDGGDAARNLMNNLNQAVNNAADSNIEVAPEVQNVSQADIISQVIDEVKANVTREVRSLEVVLNPEQLGKVQIAVENRNGIMQARIVAETEAARAAIENGIASLRETFENQGLKVDAVEVTVGNYEFFNEEPGTEQNEEANNRSGNGRRSGGREEEQNAAPEDTGNEEMRVRGSSVSYTA